MPSADLLCGRHSCRGDSVRRAAAAVSSAARSFINIAAVLVGCRVRRSGRCRADPFDREAFQLTRQGACAMRWSASRMMRLPGIRKG